MAVGLLTDSIFYKIGHGDFLHSFFSSIAFHLENSNWGSEFPILMKKLYNSKIEVKDIEKAKDELKIIRKKFEEIPPDKVIWDIEDLSKSPPWGDNIADRITDLSNYFYTSDGKDLFAVFFEALDAAKEIDQALKIESL